jgi:mannan endo-1,4-beta-mannosidase
MLNRRTLLLSGSALLATAAAPVRRPASDAFVRRSGTRFTIGGRRHRYAGSNMWYAAFLGAQAEFGSRDRLRRELDGLAALGVTNLRILGSAELSPLRNSVAPGFRTSGPHYNETLLRGLDHALAEMGRRGMKAVIYLTNFWEWSGGMMTYLYWTNGGRFLNMNDPAHPWPEFPDFVSQFYGSAPAVALYRDYIRAVVGRTNSITGRRYADDPAIMAWQLANEPRPAGSEKVGRPNLPTFYRWVRDTARLIKSIDPNHLVSTGSEGLKGCIEDAACVVTEHAIPEIDYLTTHIWPLNWGWVDSNDLPGTWDSGAEKVRDYFAQHVAFARQLGKPLVIEEFGFPRDRGLFDPGSPTTFKDRFYRLIYDQVAAGSSHGGPVAGSNFWAWGGEGRTGTPDHHFSLGAAHFVGDPPHEPQGWYSVFDRDESTKAVIRAHAAEMARLE